MVHRNVIFSILFIIAFLSLPISITGISHQPIPAIFAFGDSTVDSGNNNDITTIIRANHHPYGQDFPGHAPSGRFSNGKLTTDFLVSGLRIKELLPAYRDPRLTDDDLVTGVSFASSGSGLDDATAAATGALNMAAQLRDFDEAVKRIERAVGRNASQELLRDSLIVISVGTNDIVIKFYRNILSFKRTGNTTSSYQDFQLQRLGSFIQSLYKRGARKFGVAGLPPVGCLPLQVTVRSIVPSRRMLQRYCIDQQNVDSQAYNSKLQHLLFNLRSSLPGSVTLYFDIYHYLMDMITNPTKYGFQQALRGCCGTGLLELGPLCNRLLPTCSDVLKCIFWDSMHPTQAAYSVIAEEILNDVLQVH